MRGIEMDIIGLLFNNGGKVSPCPICGSEMERVANMDGAKEAGLGDDSSVACPNSHCPYMGAHEIGIHNAIADLLKAGAVLMEKRALETMNESGMPMEVAMRMSVHPENKFDLSNLNNGEKALDDFMGALCRWCSIESFFRMVIFNSDENEGEDENGKDNNGVQG